MEVLVIVLLAALIPAFMARDKNRSFWGYYAFGVVFLPVAIVVAFVLKNPGQKISIGVIVKVRTRVDLENGWAIDAGYTCRVEDLEVSEGGTPIVQVRAPDGSKRWLARSNVRVA